MLGWFSSRRSPSPAVGATPGTRSAAVPAPAVASPPAPAVEAPQPSTLSWLLDAPQPTPAPPTAQERALVGDLDRLMTADRLPADLLPRAAAVIPQLLALMRQESPSRAAMTQQVTKDLVLTAEVLRLARSPFYGAHPVDTLDAALDRIGTAGLNAAMARVLLKPVFQPTGQGLAVKAAPRLWQRAEQKSLCCADLIARDGGDRFEGFLAGLLHDTGWLALLRLLDRGSQGPTMPLSRVLDQALERRKDRLFGRLAADWDLSPALTTLARQMQTTPMPRVDSQLAEALRAADHACGPDQPTAAAAPN